MANNKKKFQINNKYYLCGPLALVAFLLFDVIGGFNTPGYIWSSMCTADLTALNSYSLVLSLIFSIIYAVLTVFACYCTWKFFKTTDFNKTLKKAVSLFILAAVVLSLGSNIFLQPEAGTYNKLAEQPIIGTSVQAVEDEEGNLTDSVDQFDMDATNENIQAAFDIVNNPLMIGNMAVACVSFILGLVALIFMIVGGFKKKGMPFFAGVAIFCAILFIYAAISFFTGASESLGITSRFVNYSFVLIIGILSSYVYVTNIEE